MATARLASVSSSVPSTCPLSTAGRQMRIVLKRPMMPSVMSFATEMATIWAAPAIANTSSPGVRKSM